ncbi:MAG: hypothetical protein WCL21_13270 [Mariniphaga sp.]
MSFVGDVLGKVDGIQYFYIIGLLIFMSLFGVLFYRIVRMPRQDIEEFKTSIFENDELKTN